MIFNRVCTNGDPEVASPFGQNVVAGSASFVKGEWVLLGPWNEPGQSPSATVPFDATVLTCGIQSIGGGGLNGSALLDLAIDDVDADPLPLSNYIIGYSGPTREIVKALLIPADSQLFMRYSCAVANEIADFAFTLSGGDETAWAPIRHQEYGINEGAARGTLLSASGTGEGTYSRLTATEDHPSVGYAIDAGGDTQIDSKVFVWDLGYGPTPTLQIPKTVMWSDSAEHVLESPAWLPAGMPVAQGEDIALRGRSTGTANLQMSWGAYGAIAQDNDETFAVVAQTLPVVTQAATVFIGEPPVPPAAFSAEPSITSVLLSWLPIAGADGYDLERDGEIIASGIVGTSYNDTGLQPDTHYSYRLRSVQLA